MNRRGLKDEEKKSILYIVEDVKSAQFRYQVQNIIDVMKDTKYKVEWIKTAEVGQKQKKIDEADLVIILRQTAKSDVLPKMIDEMRQKGKKVLFVLDDLVFDYRDLPLLMKSTNSKNVAYWTGYFTGIRRIARRVDGFITTNDFLGRKLERTFGKPYMVIHNSLNREQVVVADKCVKEKRREKRGADFTIGYFSGSPTHDKDIRVAEDGLLAFLGEHGEVTLKAVGYMKFHGEMKKAVEKGRIKILPLVDYRELEKLMAGVDVNIAPLVVNDFTNCKSELKFFEAGVVETTTIASPTYTFRKAITDGGNGFLAQPGEWYGKLEYLYEHPEENRKIARKAREYALKHYYGEEFLKEVEKAYDYFYDKI